jgi:GGDEF domain-containing protein
MGRTFSYVFLAVSLALFLFLVGLTGYRVETVRRLHAAAEIDKSSELLARAKALRDSVGGFSSSIFKTGMREIFSREPRLLLLAVHSKSDGFLYFIGRNKSYLKEPADFSAQWRGTPEYRYNRGYETLFTLAFPAPDTDAFLDLLFVTFGREDLYPILRDDLYVLLAFLMVCGIVFLIYSNIGEDEQRRGRTNAAVPRVGAPSSSSREDEGWREASSTPQPCEKSLTSPGTGLVWAQFFDSVLKNEIERAASTDQDLTVAIVQIDNPPPSSGLTRVYNGIASLLKEAFPLHDLLFESGVSSYGALLPETDIDRAVKSLDAFRKRVEEADVGGRGRTVSIGASSRGGRLIDAKTLKQEAVISARKAEMEGGNFAARYPRLEPCTAHGYPPVTPSPTSSVKFLPSPVFKVTAAFGLSRIFFKAPASASRSSASKSRIASRSLRDFI